MSYYIRRIANRSCGRVNLTAEILDQQRNQRKVHGESSMKLNFREAAPVKVTDSSQRRKYRKAEEHEDLLETHHDM